MEWVGRIALESSPLFCGFHGLSSQNGKEEIFTEKCKGFKRKELPCLYDRGKIKLKDLVTCGRDVMGLQEPGGSRTRQGRRERTPRDPVEEGRIWER